MDILKIDDYDVITMWLFTINDSIFFLKIVTSCVTQDLKFTIWFHIAKVEKLTHKRDDNCTVHKVSILLTAFPFTCKLTHKPWSRS